MSSKSRSLLGQEYEREYIEKNDKLFHGRLQKIRMEGMNRYCGDCGASPTQWASVTCGVFLCTECAQIHRGMGTHISKIKSCMGTYNWHPDELDRMEEMGISTRNLAMRKSYEF